MLVILIIAAVIVVAPFIGIFFIFGATSSGNKSTTPSRYDTAAVTTRAASPTEKIPLVMIEDTTIEQTYNRWQKVSGYVVNTDTQEHSVSGYLDFYDEIKVKINHVLFFVNVDANGKPAFDATSIEAKNFPTDAKFYWTAYPERGIKCFAGSDSQGGLWSG